MDKAAREAVIRTFHNKVNFEGKTIKRFIEEQEADWKRTQYENEHFPFSMDVVKKMGE